MRLTVEKAKELLDKARPEPLNAAWIRHSICVAISSHIREEKAVSHRYFTVKIILPSLRGSSDLYCAIIHASAE